MPTPSLKDLYFQLEMCFKKFIWANLTDPFRVVANLNTHW
jgi:hypothetical protein